MYSLVRSVSFRGLMTEQLPTLAASMLIAELFYKFHSFTLECLAFLATWGALDLGLQTARRWLGQRTARTA
jgi:hypothetical protein